MGFSSDDLKIIVGRANPELGNQICENLNVTPVSCKLSNFADGEIRVQIQKNVRGSDLYIIQSLQPPAENILELLLLIDAARRASARRITAVIPYFGYARQDRKEEPRVPITAKLVARMIETAGAKRVLTLDLHAAQIQGFFEIPVDHLTSEVLFKSFIKSKMALLGLGPQDIVIVSPDVGGVKRIEGICKETGVSMAIIHKRRNEPNQSEALHLIGDVKDKVAILMDDIIDTGGTLIEAASLIRKHEPKRIFAFCSHPLFSDKLINGIKVPSVDSIIKSNIEKLCITDSIPLPQEKREKLDDSGKLKVASLADLFAKAISNINLERSVSELFDN